MMLEREIFLNHRIIFLAEPVSTQVANRLIGELLLLDADNPKEPIDLYINSPGGAVTDGLAIIDTMQCIHAPVRTICVGQAASMGAWILAAGTKGFRFASPNAEVMIHQMAATLAGQTTDIHLYTQRLLRLQENLMRMMSQWTGQPLERIKQDMERQFFMTAEEAKTYGIVDHLLEALPKSIALPKSEI
ncbi:MAG: ATP-dependent Clp protease proteolytic subunit [Thermoguttaceae bacterium]|nr:ATP-dependent Clp protease proteolytic subunit [Thermoguttaceae bacterium]MDW8038986.1 ATP-dependent Clp protease proteolytic subunit [Thermoguttaceae bacterium]